MSSIDCIVDRVTRNYRATRNEINEIAHDEIDNYVSHNSIDENKDIINEYHSDIYDAIISYKDYYGDMDMDFRNKAHFYACMAYHCLWEDVCNHLYNIEKEVNNEDDEDEISDADTDTGIRVSYSNEIKDVMLDTDKLIVIASGGEPIRCRILDVDIL